MIDQDQLYAMLVSKDEKDVVLGCQIFNTMEVSILEFNVREFLTKLLNEETEEEWQLDLGQTVNIPINMKIWLGPTKVKQGIPKVYGYSHYKFECTLRSKYTPSNYARR